jgi:hypothetical protein
MLDFIFFSMSAPKKKEFPLLQFDGGTVWRRRLGKTEWDVLGYGLSYKAKLISKSGSYKGRNQSYTNRTDDLVPLLQRTVLQSLPPPPLLPYYPVRFNHIPFSLFLILLRLFIEIIAETWLMRTKKPFYDNDTKVKSFLESNSIF